LLETIALISAIIVETVAVVGGGKKVSARL